ncbi:MAG: SUMF1/EgtB/PvdO family nonheme iron enzyme [Tepidisphaeraceae bacterium]
MASLALWALAITSAARADVFNMPSGDTSLSFVQVGNPGNAPDANGLGSVPYSYQMGQYDITVSQYCDFLNAVAKTDQYGLYNGSMAPGNTFGSCGIIQSGTPGNYAYSVASGSANLPLNEVSWLGAARFCNWLENGQPSTSVENASTTEDGSYNVNGATGTFTTQQLAAISRSANAVYVIPTENEWYKVAYYKGGSANAGYWLYPTQSDTPPSNVLSVSGNNNANFEDPVLGGSDPATGISPVGSFSSSPGAFGTYDMGGDVYQWTETVSDGGRLSFGGSFNLGVGSLESNSFSIDFPTLESVDTGFRIAEVPEPGSVGVLAVGVIGLLWRRRGRRR